MEKQGSIDQSATENPRSGLRQAAPARQATEPSDRWIAALSYFSFLALIPYFLHSGRRFVVFHAKQGLVLCLLGALCGLLIMLFDLSLGRIPFLGLVLSLVLRVIIFLPLLGLAVLGLTRALARESYRLPWIGHLDVHVPDPPGFRRR